MKSLFFWGLTAILASSAYKDIVRIGAADGVDRSGTETAAVSKDGSLSAEAVSPDQNAPADTASENGSLSAGAVQGDGKVAADATPEDGNTPADRAGELVELQEPKQVALTFDDGPHKIYTRELLDGLAERKVHATFFVVGKNIEGNEELIERMEQEGHLIGNHTYDHVKICDLSGEDACVQVEKTSALVREITGHDTEFVRPPFGAWNKEMECSFVMIPVLWDVDPLDWTTKNADLVVQRVLGDVENGDIILLHDFYESSVKAALRIVDELSKQGYEFVTVDELILE